MESEKFYDSRKAVEAASLPPVEIPFASLSEDAKLGVIDALILREGTDYGAREASHESKQREIRLQIEQRKVRLVFDPNLESVNLLTEREWRQIKGPRP